MGVCVGGGVKSLAEKAPSNGRHICATFTPGRMVTHPTADFSVGGSNPGGCTPAAAPLPYCRHQSSNRRPKSLQLPALPFGHCLLCDCLFSPLLGPVSATDKKPKLCVSV